MREDAIVDLCKCGHGLREHDYTGRCRQCRKCDAVTPSGDWDSLWKERWPRKRLMQQKVKIGTLNFNKRYRNIAVDASRMVFKEEYVKGGSLGGVRFPGCLDRNYKAGEYEDRHYHKLAQEITLVQSGKVRMNGVEYGAGDIVLVEAMESTDFQVLEDAVTVVVKVPGAVNDKYMGEPGC